MCQLCSCVKVTEFTQLAGGGEGPWVKLSTQNPDGVVLLSCSFWSLKDNVLFLAFLFVFLGWVLFSITGDCIWYVNFLEKRLVFQDYTINKWWWWKNYTFRVGFRVRVCVCIFVCVCVYIYIWQSKFKLWMIIHLHTPVCQFRGKCSWKEKYFAFVKMANYKSDIWKLQIWYYFLCILIRLCNLSPRTSVNR